MRSYSAILAVALAFVSMSTAASLPVNVAEARNVHPHTPTSQQIKHAYGTPPAHFHPMHDEHMDVSCVYNDAGWLTKASDNGCPAKVNVHPSHPNNKHHPHPNQHPKKQTRCNVGKGKAAVDAKVLDCSQLCVLSSGCPKKMQSCSVPSGNGSVLNVTALNCSDINLLSANK